MVPIWINACPDVLPTVILKPVISNPTYLINEYSNWRNKLRHMMNLNPMCQGGSKYIIEVDFRLSLPK